MADPDIRQRVTAVVARRRVARDERRRSNPMTQPLGTPARPPGPIGRLHFYLVLAVSSLMSARPGESQIVTWERSSKQILNAMVSLYRAKYPLTARGIVGIQN